jgi:hypothetical protein
MRKVALALALAAVTAVGFFVAGGAAAAECPAPNPTQASSDIGLQIGDPTDAPTPTASCGPTATPSPGSSPAGSAGGAATAGGGAKGTRGSSPASSNSPQAAPAGAPGAPVPGAEPATKAGPLTLSPDRVEAGEKVLATATGYVPGEKVQLVIYPSPVIVGSYDADANGLLRVTLTVPVETKTGVHTIEATGWVSHHASNGTVTVVSAAATVAGFSSYWWLIGIGILLVLVILVSVIVFRSTISRAFTPARVPEAAS